MLDQYGEKSRITFERTSTYTNVPCISLKKAPFGPGPFQTFVLHVSLSTGQLQSCTIQKFESNAVACHPGGSRESQRNLEDAAPKQDDEEDEIDE